MGRFINIGNRRYQEAIAGEYVDKTELISHVNASLCSEFRMSCVTRCRRFGKSMAAIMLRAYYDKSCDSRDLFKGLNIEKDPLFEKHLNQYPVIYLDMTYFISKYGHNPKIVEKVQKELIEDLQSTFPNVEKEENDDLMNYLTKISQSTGERFFMIIDEWDAICREFKNSEVPMDHYVDLLRSLFKGPATEEVFVGAYITGIFPIKKYHTQSALNNFREYTMLQPGRWAPYYGFTKDEVKSLCNKYDMDFEAMEKWYDGYKIGKENSMFNPNSVMEAISRDQCDSYWRNTGAFEDVAQYIQMNYDGLKDAIIDMLAGGKCPVDYGMFNNDLKDITNKDDVLTILIHLGYLSYDPTDKKCYIPNLEVKEELIRAVRKTNWKEIISIINNSEDLLQAILEGNTDLVVQGIEKAHQTEVRVLSYNDENSLASVLSLALITAKNHYIVQRELPSGKGFADLVFIPRKNENLPVILMELKFDKSAKTAIDQIHEKNYPDSLKSYSKNIILVGINYDKKTKKHTCIIENLR